MTDRRITWFAPDRPVEGTVHVRPAQETPAPDTDLAAATRILEALRAVLDQPGVRYYAATVRDLVRVLDPEAAAALLAAARRELAVPVPRVWLPGDTVPAGVRVIADCGGPWVNGHEAAADTPLIEVVVPRRAVFAAAVAAEQARRAGAVVGSPGGGGRRL